MQRQETYLWLCPRDIYLWLCARDMYLWLCERLVIDTIIVGSLARRLNWPGRETDS
jgi:hypothetical protein